MSFWGWPNGPATRKQRWLIRKLGGQVTDGLTEGQASALIDQLKEKAK